MFPMSNLLTKLVACDRLVRVVVYVLRHILKSQIWSSRYHTDRQNDLSKISNCSLRFDANTKISLQTMFRWIAHISATKWEEVLKNAWPLACSALPADRQTSRRQPHLKVIDLKGNKMRSLDMANPLPGPSLTFKSNKVER